MPFDPVRISLSNGQEYGPVSWAEALLWSEQGRIPLDTTIIDHISGERVLASTFAVFVCNATPNTVPVSSSSPSPPPVVPALVNTVDPEPAVMDFMAFFQTYLGPVIRKRLGAQGFRLSEQGYRDVITSLGHTAHALLIEKQMIIAFEQRINDDAKRQSAIDFLVKAMQATQADALSAVIQNATAAKEILQVPNDDAAVVRAALSTAVRTGVTGMPAPPPVTQSVPPPPMPSYVAPQMPGPFDPDYAGFWRRFFAFGIDYLLYLFTCGIGLGSVSAPVLILAQQADPDTGAMFQIVVYLITFVITTFLVWLYYAIMESAPTQGTLGKMALGLIVTDMEGQRISFWRATGRFFGKFISGAALGIGFFKAGYTEKKQANHDIYAETLVILKPRRHDRQR